MIRAFKPAIFSLFIWEQAIKVFSFFCFILSCELNANHVFYFILFSVIWLQSLSLYMLMLAHFSILHPSFS